MEPWRTALCLVGLMLTLGFARVREVHTQVESPFAGFAEPAFPFITATLDAGGLAPGLPARNLAVRCVVLLLGNETYACFDTDLLRVAASWHGRFMSLETMAQISYHQAANKANGIPRVLGRPISATGIYPGWMGATPSFTDPRPAGPNPDAMGRGPVSGDLARWNGLFVVGDQAVLAYSVQGTEVHEQLSSIVVDDRVGLARSFRMERIARPLTLVIGEVGPASISATEGDSVLVIRQPGHDTVTAVGLAGGPPGATLQLEQGRYITLRLPARTGPSEIRLVTWRGAESGRGVLDRMLARSIPIPEFEKGGPAHWPGVVATRGRLAPDTSAYVVDLLTLPIPNPWRRNVRVAGLDFFRDGRAAVVTFDGDVWIVSGIDAGLQNLRWRRFASGLYEPLSLQIVDDIVYVFDRGGIVRLHDLNDDGEADHYENFSNLPIQSGESREFPMSMVKKPGGGFYLAIGGALDGGPRTSPAIMRGFRAGSPHSGTIQEVSADGRAIRTFASGFREPFIGAHPERDFVTASDQQGHFVPSTPIYSVQRGGYYGVPATAHRDDPPAAASPLVWLPHSVDRSGAGQVWITGDRMGTSGDALIHLSYGAPGAFRVYIDSATSPMQGVAAPLQADYPAPVLKGQENPLDGQLYLAGFQIYGSSAREVSGLSRLRYTGRPPGIPTSVRAGAQGILLRFESGLDPSSARDPSRYRVRRWDYRRTEEYGSGHFLSDGTPGQEKLGVMPYLSADSTALLLVVPDMREAMQMEVEYSISDAGGRLLNNHLYLTLHRVEPLDMAAADFGGMDWRAGARRAASAAAADDMASSDRGAKIFQRMGCNGCHSTDGSQGGKMGPTMRGLYGSERRFTDRSTQRAFDGYLRDSILQPSRQIVRGFQEGMPAYVGALDESEVESLILYIRSLGAPPAEPVAEP